MSAKVPYLVNRVAKKVMRDLGSIKLERIDRKVEFYFDDVLDLLRAYDLNHAQLGVLAGYGSGFLDSSYPYRTRTSMHDIHCGNPDWIDKCDSGIKMLMCIAASAVLAHIVDTLYHQRKP